MSDYTTSVTTGNKEAERKIRNEKISNWYVWNALSNPVPKIPTVEPLPAHLRPSDPDTITSERIRKLRKKAEN